MKKPRIITKKFVAYVLTFAMVLSLLPGMSAVRAEAAGGTILQNAEGYYELSDAADLAAFRDLVNGGEKAVNAVLTADIELSGTWAPISTATTVADQYAGTFDGNNKKITGLNISAAATNQGLFGAVNGATIKNLSVEGNVSSSKAYVGGIVGKLTQGKIENCSFSGSVSTTITSTSGWAGGITGYSGNSNTQKGTITGCVNKAAVTGGVAGGIVGGVKASTVSNCYNTGSIKGENKSAGIVGQAQSALTISNCYNIGEITAGSANTADIVAFQMPTTAFDHCYYPSDGVLYNNANATPGTVTDCGVIDKDTLLASLGSAFAEDSSNINNGYPILAWESGQEVTPKDPKIKISGAAPLYLTNSGSPQNGKLTVQFVDMDAEAISWSITSGEDVISITEADASDANRTSVTVTPKAAGMATVAAQTADGTCTDSAEIAVYPYITGFDLEGSPVAGAEYSASVTVLGGAAYDYENYPALNEFTWKYFDSQSDYTSNPSGGTTISGKGRTITVPAEAEGKWLTATLYYQGEYKTPSSRGKTVLSSSVPVTSVTIDGTRENGAILETSSGTALTANGKGADGRDATNVTYQWQKYEEEWDDWEDDYVYVWNNISGATDQTFQIPDDTSAINAQYRVQLSGDASSTVTSKTIKVTELSDTLKVNADKEALTVSGAEAIYETGSLTLPASGTNGSAITWASSNEEYIGADGTVKKLPDTGTLDVTLTATLSMGDATATKEIVCTLYSAEAASDEQTLDEAISKYALGVLVPTFGTDTNLAAFLENDLVKKGYQGITAEVTSAQRRSYPSNGTAAIAANGDITYFYDEPMALGSMGKGSYAQFDVVFTLTKGAASKQLEKTVNLYWDVDQLCSALQSQILDNLTWDVIKADNTSQDNVTSALTLPQYLGGKDGGNLLTPITWTSSDESVLSIKAPTGSSDDISYGPYTGTVKQTFDEQKVTLTAAIKYNKTNSGANVETDGVAALKQEFELTIPPLDAQELLADMQTKLDAGVTAAKFKDSITKEAIDPDAVVNDIQFVTPKNTGIEGYDDYKFTYSSVDTDTLKVNGNRGVVYRPLPGEADQTVNVTVTMTLKKNDNLSVSKEIPLTIKPLTQAEIDQGVILMDKAVNAYWDGIKGENTDKSNVTSDLHAFQEINLDAEGNAAFVYNVNDMTNAGVYPESYVENPDGSSDDEYTKFHSSKPSIIQHSFPRIMATPEYDTQVTMESYLSHEIFAKYYTKYRDTDAAKAAPFTKFYRQRAAVTVTVKGENGEDPNPDAKIAVTIAVNGADGEAWAAAEKLNVEKDAILGDALAPFLTDKGMTYTGSMNYIKSITSAQGVTLAEFDRGENSGWLYRVNGTLADEAISQYVLKDGDSILLFYTNDYSKEKKTIDNGSGEEQKDDPKDDQKDDQKPDQPSGSDDGKVKPSGSDSSGKNSITPTAKELKNAKLNKSIPKVNTSSVKTKALTKTNKMQISFKAVKGATNYRVAYRKAGAKKWTEKWTGGKTTYTLPVKMKKKGLYQFRITVYKKTASGWQKGAASKINYRYYVRTAAKYKAAKKSIKVKINKVKGASGYQILYSTNKSMKNAKIINIKGSEKTSKSIKKLKSGKTYYVQVRTYKMKDKKKYIGILSAVKKVKVK